MKKNKIIFDIARRQKEERENKDKDKENLLEGKKMTVDEARKILIDLSLKDDGENWEFSSRENKALFMGISALNYCKKHGLKTEFDFNS